MVILTGFPRKTYLPPGVVVIPFLSEGQETVWVLYGCRTFVEYYRCQGTVQVESELV